MSPWANQKLDRLVRQLARCEARLMPSNRTSTSLGMFVSRITTDGGVRTSLSKDSSYCSPWPCCVRTVEVVVNSVSCAFTSAKPPINMDCSVCVGRRDLISCEFVRDDAVCEYRRNGDDERDSDERREAASVSICFFNDFELSEKSLWVYSLLLAIRSDDRLIGLKHRTRSSMN